MARLNFLIGYKIKSSLICPRSLFKKEEETRATVSVRVDCVVDSDWLTLHENTFSLARRSLSF